MSELRWDPLKRSWAIVTRDPGHGPRDFQTEREKVTVSLCPFCPGQEAKTPGEVFALRSPETGAWRVRVIPNKYPALRIEGDLDKRGVGLYEAMNGIGAHEVIVETPDHGRDLADLETGEIADVLLAWRSRLLDLRRDPRFRYIVIFKNHGVEAGAGIPHSHSQLIAVPLTPPVASTELAVCREYFERRERCLLCDLLAQEMEAGLRVVANDGRFLLYAPFAGSFPFELRLAPLAHGHDFALLGDADLPLLAAALKDALERLRAVLRDPPYNFILHTSPPMHLRPGRPDYWRSLPYDYHWHIELVPRLTKIAGFEWGTGFHINPTPPEDAARHLREADLNVRF